MKIDKSNLKFFFWIFLIIFCIQATDLKIGFVKISEIILLLLAPFFLLKPINKYLGYFLIFFSLNFFLSFIITSTLNFEKYGSSLIKAPYIISIARYLELVTCIVVGLITIKLFKDYPRKKIIPIIVNINVYLTLFFVFIYTLVILNILPQESSIVVYESSRLRGLYFEGGPFGLMLAFIFILTFFEGKSNILLIKRFFLLFVIIFLAKSKAGIMLSLVWLLMYFYKSLYEIIKNYRVPIVSVFVIIFYIVFTNIGATYLSDTKRFKKEVKERPRDPYLILGRISGRYIVPNMIKQYPVFGIGIGNYPLLRNNPEIRGFFPIPPKAIINIDSHGYGGIVDVIVDMGFVGLIFFLGIIYLLYKEISMKKDKGKILLFAFIFLFMFGVQLIFLYPWIFLGTIIAYKNNDIYEISD